MQYQYQIRAPKAEYVEDERHTVRAFLLAMEEVEEEFSK